MFNNYNPQGPKVWSQVGVHVDQVADLRGYANCGTEHRPNFANSFVNLSVAYSALGQFDMAIGTLQRAVTLQPNDSAALNNLATLFYLTGRYAEALPIYIEAVRRDPSAVRYMNLGDGYDRLKRTAEARSAYERALEQADKEFAATKAMRTMAVSAKCAAKLGRVADAERRALMAMSAAPADAEVRYKLAVVYALNNRIADALDALEKAIALKYPLVYIRLDRDLSALANHPKFKALTATKND
jgi:tetratricopeptide (TPR) repeat protein